MKDQFNRTVDYLRVSLTDRCNLRCKYCMPARGPQARSSQREISLEEQYQLIRGFLLAGVKKVRLTGGEPLLKEGLLPFIEKVKALGMEELVLTTNGILLPEMARDLQSAGIDRVNISLDTLDGEQYKAITRGGDLSRVLKGIEIAKQIGWTPIKTNTVLMRGFNEDQVEPFLKLAQEGIQVRFIELMPIGEATAMGEQRISSGEILERYPMLQLLPGAPGSTAKLYSNQGKGIIGFIDPVSCNFCQGCNRIRLTSEGKLKLCLHAPREYDMRPLLRQAAEGEILLEEEIQALVSEKPERHHLAKGEFLKVGMHQIGG